ncbi:DUF4241 domain-containing protein [Fulvimarina sp. MAC8]|uniref:DUF4241 domain-containing protein n=1 Tax=Fulvimarina sp. MAC8 TaxID=3162874 RepID=UPI0032EBF64B
MLRTSLLSLRGISLDDNERCDCWSKAQVVVLQERIMRWSRTVALCLLALGTLIMADRSSAEISEISSNAAVFALSEEELAQRGLKIVTIGELDLPDGRLIAMDPLVFPDRKPQQRKVEPGRYPVGVVIGTPKYSRPAILFIRFSKEIPVRFEAGLAEGQSADGLKEDEFYGVPVDAGLAALSNTAFTRAMDAREKLEAAKPNSKFDNYYDNVLSEQFPGSSGDEYGLHFPMEGDAGAAVISQSGWGDGFYPIIWGIAEDGDPAVAYLDFYVIEDADNSDDPEVIGERMEASMSGSEKSANREALQLLASDDGAGFSEMLRSGAIGAKDYVLGRGGSFAFEAIRTDKPNVLRAMIEAGLTNDLSQHDEWMEDIGGYIAYARYLQARSSATGESGGSRIPPRSSELLAVIAEWERRVGTGDKSELTRTSE